MDARVLYVDLEPSVAADGATILEGDDNAAYLCADVRDAEAILGSAEARRLFDLDQPLAVLFIETLLYLSDSENPAYVVRSYVDRLPSGSYVGIVHFSEDEELANGLGLFSRMFGTPPAVTLRDGDRVVEFLDGLDVEDPGVVPVPLWKPEAEGLVKNPDRVPVHAGLGRKP
ncbi:SAM-dependent methyltransferase [Prauserella muralis]|uniref:SAM-dependent methyltransferase n=1 Tax=Prauserella muralis TaxID=588067 RepID=UPI0020110C3A|nr:SAM-dependent methyltransferase [Prauserella muralis]